MEIQIGEGAAGIRAVETNDREILILDPDAPDEASIARFFLWSDIKNERAHFPEEFAADVIEIVVLRVQPAVVEINHLQKTQREKLGAEVEQAGHAGGHAVHGIVADFGKRLEVEPLGKFRAADEVVIAIGNPARRHFP